jgi:transposase
LGPDHAWTRCRPRRAVQMIDISIVCAHQHGACIAANGEQLMGRSRGGLTSKVHAVVDTNGLPVRLALAIGEALDHHLIFVLLAGLKSGAMLLADREYDADWIRALVSQHGAWPNIPPKRNRKEATYFSPISIALVIWSSGSSTRLSNVGVSHSRRQTCSQLLRLHSACIQPAVVAG